MEDEVWNIACLPIGLCDHTVGVQSAGNFGLMQGHPLSRRIPTKKILEDEVLALVKERSDKGIKINWRFSITDASNRHYAKVNKENNKYDKI